MSQLLDHFEPVLAIFEPCKIADVIYLDFTKAAFDKVDFNIVLIEIKSLDISGKLFQCLKSFLVGRTQSVAVGAKNHYQLMFSQVYHK